MTRTGQTPRAGWWLATTSLIAVLLLGAARAGASSATVIPPRGTQTVTVGCAHTALGQLNKPFSRSAGNVIAGQISWPVLRNYASSLPSRAFIWPQRLGLAVKALAVVRAGAVVRVVIPSSERGRLSLYYVSANPRRQTNQGSLYRVADGEREVTFRACGRSAARPPFSQFPGYFIVRGAQCAVIDVRTGSGGASVKRQIPFGVASTSCPADV